MATVKTVMVSSTALDLPRHREAVLNACLTLGMQPIMMEHLTASHQHPVEKSLEMVEKADIYVGIFASRYGYIPENSDVSITELEYHYAIETKKPTLIFFASDDHPTIGFEDDDPESHEKLARLKRELLAAHIVEKFRSPEDLNIKVRDSLLPYRDSDSLNPQVPQKLSGILAENLLHILNRKIDTLTHEQYRVLKSLENYKRMAIEGCAGSGKTMLAAQKALMLHALGKRTLILCHSNPLAEHIRELVQGTNIAVYDFPSWINMLNEDESPAADPYNLYGYVDEQKLNQAFDKLEEMNQKYDAIIVDEGQDFREELWWLVIESALKSVEDGIFYVFYDSYQELHTGKVKFPIPAAPYKLIQNCRNVGKIFHLVQAMYPDYVESFPILEAQGFLDFGEFSADPDEQRAAITEAVQTALQSIAPENLVVLTTEFSAEDSAINRLQILAPTKAKWQDGIRWYLGGVGLSDEPLPTEQDIHAVVRAARDRYVGKPDGLWQSVYEQARWLTTSSGLRLNRENLARIFFTSERWAEGLPTPKYVVIDSEMRTPNAIRLSTVSAFKGLESDGVILFVHNSTSGRQKEFERHLYVGLSRAKLLLFVVYDRAILRKIPYRLRPYFGKA